MTCIMREGLYNVLSKQSKGSHTLPRVPEGCVGVLQVQEGIGHAQRNSVCEDTVVGKGLMWSQKEKVWCCYQVADEW